MLKIVSSDDLPFQFVSDIFSEIFDQEINYCLPGKKWCVCILYHIICWFARLRAGVRLAFFVVVSADGPCCEKNQNRGRRSGSLELFGRPWKGSANLWYKSVLSISHFSSIKYMKTSLIASANRFWRFQRNSRKIWWWSAKKRLLWNLFFSSWQTSHTTAQKRWDCFSQETMDKPA